MKRGEILVANLNPPRARESGKLRPVLTVQADQLTAADTPLVIVLLQTTQVYSRFRLWSVSIPARHSLQRDCQVIVDQPRALHRPLFEFGPGPLTALTSEEMQTAGRSLRLALELFLRGWAWQPVFCGHSGSDRAATQEGCSRDSPRGRSCGSAPREVPELADSQPLSPKHLDHTARQQSLSIRRFRLQLLHRQQ